MLARKRLCTRQLVSVTVSPKQHASVLHTTSETNIDVTIQQRITQLECTRAKELEKKKKKNICAAKRQV